MSRIRFTDVSLDSDWKLCRCVFVYNASQPYCCCTNHTFHTFAVHFQCNITKKFAHVTMLLKPNTVVVVLKGRFAGKKGVVVKLSEDGKRALVAGVQKMPRPVTDDTPEWKKDKLSKMHVFIKNYNAGHLLATRYRGDVGLGMFDFSKTFNDTESKKETIDIVKKTFYDANKQRKAKWLFSKLAF